MKKVLLVNPPDTHQDGFTCPPLGLLYIAGTLLTHGFQVQVIDGCLEGGDSVVRALSEYRPDIVGITCLTPGRKRALWVAQHSKQICPEAMVVMGGAHPTIMYRQILEHYPYVDCIILGEGETTFLELARGNASGNIKGLAFREGGAITRNAPRPNIENLDELPFPAWHLLDLKHYSGWGYGRCNGVDLLRETRVSVVFSRGCKGHCDFCSSWWVWRGWRHRSATNMVDEIELLYRDHGIRHFCFADDALTVDRQATIEMCDEILRRGLVIAFHATTRTDCVDREVLEKLKAAGCYKVAFGVETGSPQLLERMNKENDVQVSAKAIGLCREIGLPVTALIIIGSRGETEQTVRETRDFLRKTRPDEVGCAGGLWILPGTTVYQQCKQEGYIDDNFWLGDEPYKVFTLEHSPRELARFERLIYGYRGFWGTTLARVRRVFRALRKVRRYFLSALKQVFPNEGI